MTTLEDLLDDPALPDLAEAINRRLEDEQARRERFYDEISEQEKAEFINGEVVVHSPARDKHSLTKDLLADIVRAHCRMAKMGIVRGEKALCVFPRNDYEPDLCYFSREKAELIGPETMKYPVPDWVCEILSPSTARHDRGVKFRDYEMHGVAEYWIIDADAETVEQYLARDGKYELEMKSGSGEIRSVVISGLRVPIRAIFDEGQNLAALRKLLA